MLEIGPGAGSLTYKLSEYAKGVVCYEIDKKLQPILEETLTSCANVEVIYQDFLKSNVMDILKKYDYDKLYVVANLPYYITTPIIVKLIVDHIPVEKIVVMVQKEVGNRFKATPGSKEYGSLTVFLDYYFDVKKIIDVSKNVFLPKPNVDSIVVQFTKKEQPLKAKSEKHFFQLVRDSFKQKRKISTLGNINFFEWYKVDVYKTKNENYFFHGHIEDGLPYKEFLEEFSEPELKEVLKKIDPDRYIEFGFDDVKEA